MHGTGVNLNFEVCPLAEVYIASFPLVSSPDPTYERVGSGDETTFPPAFARVLVANFIPQAGLNVASGSHWARASLVPRPHPLTFVWRMVYRHLNWDEVCVATGHHARCLIFRLCVVSNSSKSSRVVKETLYMHVHFYGFSVIILFFPLEV